MKFKLFDSVFWVFEGGNYYGHVTEVKQTLDGIYYSVDGCSTYLPENALVSML